MQFVSNFKTFSELSEAWCEWTTHRPNAVVFNDWFKSPMQLPSILCAALSSLPATPLIFCVTDFVLQWNKTCKFNCVEISLVRLTIKVVRKDLAPFSANVENHWANVWCLFVCCAVGCTLSGGVVVVVFVCSSFRGFKKLGYLKLNH